jgi:hypothetical protein
MGGSLDLSGTDITSLPDNLSVGGYLISENIGQEMTKHHIL